MEHGGTDVALQVNRAYNTGLEAGAMGRAQ